MRQQATFHPEMADPVSSKNPPAQRRGLPLVAATTLGLCLQLLPASAAAHIELELPLNRYSNIRAGENKACPCGSGTTSRRCNNPEEFSDTDRSLDRITTFAPGDTITVRFAEYVDHGGRYRIAFDPDGAELADFNQHILLDEPDPEGTRGNTGADSLWEFQVTLPDMTCDNCTLQLIQVMDGNTEEPVLDPSTRGGTYFQCADIVLAEGTPAGGIPPVAPSEHLAERRRPEPAPRVNAAPVDPALPDAMQETARTAPGGDTLSGSGSSPAADAGTGMAGRPRAASESTCSLAAGRSPREALPLLAVLASMVAVAARRLRRAAGMARAAGPS